MLAETLAYNRLMTDLLLLKIGVSEDQLKPAIDELMKNLKVEKLKVLSEVLAHYGDVDFDGLLSDNQKDES